MLGEAIRRAGFEVSVAGDWAAALTVIERQPIVLMITDVRMRVNGFALARLARARRPMLPVLFITGYADITPLSDPDATRGNLMSKDAGLDAIVQRVISMLDRRPVERAAE